MFPTTLTPFLHIPGNLVTTVALLMHPKLRGHVTTMFVLSLCVSDLLFCSINLPLTANRYIKQHWGLGPSLCQMFAFVFYGNEAVSLLSMVAITINRWVFLHLFVNWVVFVYKYDSMNFSRNMFKEFPRRSSVCLDVSWGYPRRCFWTNIVFNYYVQNYAW